MLPFDFTYSHSPAVVTCPTCGARPSEVCRTRAGVKTNPHKDRIFSARQALPTLLKAAQDLASLSSDKAVNFIALVEQTAGINASVQTKLNKARRLIHGHAYKHALLIECFGDQVLFNQRLAALFDPDSKT